MITANQVVDLGNSTIQAIRGTEEKFGSGRPAILVGFTIVIVKSKNATLRSSVGSPLAAHFLASDYVIAFAATGSESNNEYWTDQESVVGEDYFERLGARDIAPHAKTRVVPIQKPLIAQTIRSVLIFLD